MTKGKGMGGCLHANPDPDKVIEWVKSGVDREPLMWISYPERRLKPIELGRHLEVTNLRYLPQSVSWAPYCFLPICGILYIHEPDHIEKFLCRNITRSLSRLLSASPSTNTPLSNLPETLSLLFKSLFPGPS